MGYCFRNPIKVFLILAIALSISFQGVLADYTVKDESDQVYMKILNSGDVGIGKSNPTEKLDVAGNIVSDGVIYSLSDAGDQTYLVKKGIISDGDIYLTQSDGNNLYLGNAANNGIIRLDSSKTLIPYGTLGVGSNDPDAKVDIDAGVGNDALDLSSGNLIGLGNIDLAGGSGTTSYITLPSSPSSLCIQNTLNDDVMCFESNQFVSIGNGTAQDLLHVFGEETSAIRISNNVATETYLRLLTSNDGNAYIERSNSDTPGTRTDLLFTGAGQDPVDMIIKASGRVGINTINPDSYLEVEGNVSIRSTENPALRVGSSSEGYVQIGGSKIYDNDSHFVLDASGSNTINLKDNVDIDGNLEMSDKDVTNVNDAYIRRIYDNDNTGFYVDPASTSQVNKIDFGTGYIDWDGTYLNIGHENGQIYLNSGTANTLIKGDNIYIGDNSDDVIHFRDNVVKGTTYQAEDADGLEFKTDEGTTRFFIEDSGDIGIGVSNPDNALDISGTLDVSSTSYLNGIVMDANTDITRLDTLQGEDDLTILAKSGNTNDIYIANDGDVGIGTNSLGTNDMVVSGKMEITSGSDYGLRVGSGETGYIQIGDSKIYDNGELYLDSQEGLVHILDDVDIDGNLEMSNQNITNIDNVYAKRIYDNDNTGFYVDPASTSNMNDITVDKIDFGTGYIDWDGTYLKIGHEGGRIYLNSGSENSYWYGDDIYLGDNSNDVIHFRDNVVKGTTYQAEDADGLEFKTDEGTTRLFIEDSGDIGIGVANPDNALDISGTLDVSSTSYLNGIVLDNDADITGADLIQGYNDLRLSGDATGGPDLIISAEGNVGIGASPNTNQLYVDGNLDLDGTLDVLSTSSFHGNIELNDNDITGANIIQGTDGLVLRGNASTNDLSIGTDGKVTIHSSADSGLTIGNGATGYVKIGGSRIYDANGNLVLDSDSGTIDILNDNLDLNDNTLDNVNLAYIRKIYDEDNTSYYIDPDNQSKLNNLIVQDNLYVIGRIANVGVTNVETNGTIYPTIHDQFDLGTSSQKWKDLYLSGNIDVDGIITTGTSGITLTDSTGYILETAIKQNTLDDSEIEDNSLTANSLATDSVGSDEIQANAVTNSELDNFDDFTMAGLTVETNTLYANANEVGIGTTNPGNTLHVNGGIRVSDLTASRLVATDANKDLVSTITSSNLHNSVTETTGTAGNLVFSTAPTLTTLTVSSGGIDVTGDSSINGILDSLTGITSSGDIIFSDLTANRLVTTTTGGQLTNSISSSNLASSITDETGTAGNIVFSTSPTMSDVTISSGGIDVTGDSVFNDDFEIKKSSALIKLGTGSNGGPHGIDFYDDDNTKSMSLYYRTSPDDLYVEDSSGNKLFTVESTGNVGIGTDSPGSKFEVNGEAHIASTANPGLTIGNGAIGYVKMGGSTIYDNNGNLVLNSDTADVQIHDNLYVRGGQITGANSAYIELGETDNVVTIHNGNADYIRITNTKLDLSGISLDAGDITSNTITDTQIQDNSLTANSLATDSVDSDEIQANAVTASELAGNAVESTHIKDGEVKNADLATNSVSLAKMQDNSVDSAEIVANAVGNSELDNAESYDMANLDLDSAGKITENDNDRISFDGSGNIIITLG